MSHRKSPFVLLVIATLPLPSCNRLKLPSGSSDGSYISALEQGLTEQIDVVRLPRGEVHILQGLLPEYASGLRNELKFPSQSLEIFQRAQKDGLLNLAETRPTGPSDAWEQMGVQAFIATPTDKLGGQLRVSGESPFLVKEPRLM